MKVSNWITENKTLIVIPLLALLVAVVVVAAYSITGHQNNADPAPAASYPTPTINTADTPADSNQAATPAAVQSPAAAELKSDTAKVVFQVDGMSCSGCISTIKSSLASYKGIRDIIVNISGGTAEVYYDTDQINDPERLASSITASGYPARVARL